MRKLFTNLTFQVLSAITIGIILGAIAPNTANYLKPLSDIFINMVKMVIAPIIFFTIVLGIAKMGDMKKVGRVGGKALLYFEIVTTFALIIGLVVANVVEPGEGVPLNSTQYNKQVDGYVHEGEKMDMVDFLIHIVPSNVVDSFAKGDILQVVFFAVLFGFALASLGQANQLVIEVFERISQAFFKLVNMVMRVAPLGALGAISYTIGHYGLSSLIPLGKLMLAVYLTMIFFVFVILNLICKIYGFSLWKYLKFIKEEILIVLGTSSSESVLPRMMHKMEAYGCSRSVVGLVLPTGYSFNLDGTSIYLTMAVVFLAQVSGVDLSLTQELTVIAILMLTSKGAATVTGGGFIVLASTLGAMQVIPMEGLALLLGVDRFMSEARALVNMIGNGIATIVVAKSEQEFDEAKQLAAEQKVVAS
ncbi:dicarboxylate/amino acid:cation symporter [Laceyella sacchari]|uniref:Dicarboxylate/amino acid:cation symporter n=1 Tax=Laceyella sacchari TaxID=37482 RepID=A0ABY5U071_LACSH|nr:dicarboxylate/amino acid:cation symporter [Laceyella sacchari]TCW37410.1 aerobic C4-dicarboxylate transport protein [Laceyella sacchari]UWE02584.1 dicarboxylate/amino acid:cation symporter [Laceyella sacchari]